MSFRSKKFYGVSFIACLISAILVKIIRQIYFGFNDFLDIFLGSAPSFLYLFGSISLIPVIKENISFTSYKKAALMFTLGALLYEAEQAWTERVFDFYDVLATVFAYTIIMAINTNEPVKT